MITADFTERKKTEEKLKACGAIKRERDLLQSVMNGAKNIHLVYLDNEFNFVRVNEAYAKTCGYKAEEMIGKNHFALYPHEENEAIFKRVRDTGAPAQFHDKPFVFPDQPKRGVTYWDWTLEPIKNAAGKVEGLVFSLVETTERKKAETELSATKNRLAEELVGLSKLQEISMRFVTQDKMQALLDGIVNSAIEITHADMGTMQLLNEDNILRFVSQRGFKQSYLDFFKYINPDSHTVCGEAMRSKKRVIVDDVTQSPVFVNTPALKVLLEAGVRAIQSTPLFTRSVKFLGVLTTYYQTPHKPDEFDLRLLDLLVRQAADFVERVENEQKLDEYAKNLEKVVEERTKQLKDAERLAAIGATAGMVGHDIRNPLQGITSDVYLIKTDLALMPESEAKESMSESLEGIEDNVEYINKIVQDLQDYAKPIIPTLQETDFERLCQEVLFKNDVPANISASLRVEKQAKKLVADPELLKRILSNLVSNAVQAMPEGGKVELCAYQETGDVIITVEDTGVGIPEEIKPKLFTPLFTTKCKGQGFGLAVVKRLIEALGGTVSFESERGKGTKFIIRLPQKEVNSK